jgi:hypothetical protein
MNPMDTSNRINLGLLLASILSCVISVWAARKANRHQKASSVAAERSASAAERSEQHANTLVGIEQRRDIDVAIGAQKARLRAQLENEGTAMRPVRLIRIYNDGNAAARNIRLAIHGHPSIGEKLEASTVIAAGGSFRLYLSARGNPPNGKAVLEWDDETEQRGYSEQTLG